MPAVVASTEGRRRKRGRIELRRHEAADGRHAAGDAGLRPAVLRCGLRVGVARHRHVAPGAVLDDAPSRLGPCPQSAASGLESSEDVRHPSSSASGAAAVTRKTDRRMSMTKIAIIGAGLSGRLVALHLCRSAAPVDRITMIDRCSADCMGPAYPDDADNLLLNVPAVRMGAFPEDPEHFLKWARQKRVDAATWDFLPRSLYRKYILELLHEAHARAGAPEFEQVRGEVTDVEVDRAGATVRLDSGKQLAVDKVVLALGNFPPGDPPILNRRALRNPRYLGDPWAAATLNKVTGTETVFLIGTGQTAVDLAVALHKRGHEGRIIAMSRRGTLPLAHRGFESYPSFFAEIKDARRVLDISKVVRAHVKSAQARGMDIRSVIDSLRPDTQALWFALPEDEKRRFVRHLFRDWEIVRSRLPPQTIAVIETMRASGRLEIIAGRIRDLVEKETRLEVYYMPRGEATVKLRLTDLVINCIGPESDYRRIDHVLVRNLMHRGLIRPGPANLGIDCLPNGAILDSAGAPSSVLYTLGSTMKGVLWEVLAVPDIRLQAQRLADLLIHR